MLIETLGLFEGLVGTLQGYYASIKVYAVCVWIFICTPYLYIYRLMHHMCVVSVE